MIKTMINVEIKAATDIEAVLALEELARNIRESMEPDTTIIPTTGEGVYGFTDPNTTASCDVFRREVT